MVRPGRDLLTGRVEVDETYLGGLEEGLRGRLTEEKALIVLAAQEDGMGIGRIRMRQIPDASAISLESFLLESVAPGSVVHTDGWSGYTGITAKGYVHEVTIVKRSKQTASQLLPRVHRVFSLLKRWLMGTHQEASVISILTTTWTSSASASTGEDRKAAASFSSAWRSRRWPPIPSPTI
jgi:transposase-like protein